MANSSGMGSHWPAQQFHKRLGRTRGRCQSPRQRMFPRQILHGVAADLCLIVAQAQAGEILREAFVKPVLRRRIVEIQEASAAKSWETARQLSSAARSRTM